jgi:hypothetical protein
MRSKPEPDPLDLHIGKVWNGEADDPVLSAIFGGDDRFPHVTADAVGEALKGFPAVLSPGCTLEGLATNVRRAFALVTPPAEGLPDIWPGNAVIRDKYRKVAKLAHTLRTELEALGGPEEVPIIQALNDEGMKLYGSMPALLEHIAFAFNAVADRIKPQHGNWRGAERSEIRIKQARCLSVIFEAAFCSWKATVIDPRDLPSDDRSPASYGPWPDFFARMTVMATGERLTADQVRETLKAARKHHRKDPVQLPPGIFPLL